MDFHYMHKPLILFLAFLSLPIASAWAEGFDAFLTQVTANPPERPTSRADLDRGCRVPDGVVTARKISNALGVFSFIPGVAAATAAVHATETICQHESELAGEARYIANTTTPIDPNLVPENAEADRYAKQGWSCKIGFNQYDGGCVNQ